MTFSAQKKSDNSASVKRANASLRMMKMGVGELYSANANKFSDSEDEADLESYSQMLAESIMEDAAAGMPDEDDEPVFDWSDDSDGDEKAAVDREAPLRGCC